MLPRAFRGAAALVTFAAGAAALGTAAWTRPVADGDAALAAGDLAAARAAYARAEARFDRVPALRQVLADDYARVAGAQLRIAYQLQHFDDVIDAAQRAPEAAAPHFWAGLALLAKAREDVQPEAQMTDLARAEEELRRAVEHDPGDLDTKYDFELVSRLAAGLRKQPRIPPNQLMQLLREPPRVAAKPVKRIG